MRADFRGPAVLGVILGCLGTMALLAADVGEFRVWKDQTGVYSVEAVLLEFDETTVLLRKKDGSTVRVPIARLSPADREYLRSLGWKPRAESGKQPPDGRQRLSREELLRQVEPAVVHIKTDRGSSGSGFFVDQDLVVTNFHVIEDAEQATAKVGKETYRVLGFLAVERGKDLALLRVDRPQGGPTLRIASQLPQKLEEVYAFGSPLGLEKSVTRGEVSAVRTCREIRQEAGRPFAPPEFDDDLTLIQTTAPISPGNSGGPLVNGFGEVVGVNAGSISARVGAQNVNFAISCVDLQEFILRHKGDPLRTLANLPRPRPPEIFHRTPTKMDEIRVELPGGDRFSLSSVMMSEKEVDDFARMVTNWQQTNTVAYRLRIPDVGNVLTGILFRRTGPALFGLPNTYAFVWREKTEIREETQLVGIFGAVHDRALGVVATRTVQTPVTTLIPIGTLCYEKGKLHGRVSIYVNGQGIYHGLWERGGPSQQGMFVLYEGGQWTLLKRDKGTSGQLFLFDGIHLLRSFDTLEKAMADPEGKAKLDAFLACEATVKAIGEQIANAFQREAKELQQKVIADLALQTRAENIRRGIEQRAKFAAVVEEGFREAARRSGW